MPTLSYLFTSRRANRVTFAAFGGVGDGHCGSHTVAVNVAAICCCFGTSQISFGACDWKIAWLANTKLFMHQYCTHAQLHKHTHTVLNKYADYTGTADFQRVFFDFHYTNSGLCTSDFVDRHASAKRKLYDL